MVIGKSRADKEAVPAIVELADQNRDIVFSFPEIHPQASLSIRLLRTLRVPTDGHTYPLPAALGVFPLQHVDDHSERLPKSWIEHGGVMLPMYQGEALWISFKSSYIPEHRTNYPFAVKVSSGKIDCITGKPFLNELSESKQDYVVAPAQPWLDGFHVGDGVVGQFVAAPLGSGETVEEQVSEVAEFGGLQFVVYPMKSSEFNVRFPKAAPRRTSSAVYSIGSECFYSRARPSVEAELGLGIGGSIKQELYRDSYGTNVWDQSTRGRIFVHLLNSLAWKEATGAPPPTHPMTARDYAKAGLPWFDYYASDTEALRAGPVLGNLKPIAFEKNSQQKTVSTPNVKTIFNKAKAE